MRPGQKGWLKEYFDRIGEVCAGAGTPQLFDDRLHRLNDDVQLYGVLQPTGLLYGHPVGSFRDYGYNTRYWTQREKMSLVLSDAFVNRAFLTYRSQIGTRSDLMDVLHLATKELVQYYHHVHEGRFGRRNRAHKRLSDMVLAERIIDHSITLQGGKTNALLSRFLYNSLLFIDVYYYGQWIREDRRAPAEDFQSRQEAMRCNLLKTIACAAHADRTLKKEERQLFEVFLESAQLPRERAEEARAYMHGDLSLSDLDLSHVSSWIEKKYYLELAILTIWSDRELHELEEAFLRSMIIKLGMRDTDLDDSMTAIQGFVLSHWEKVYFLQRKHQLQFVKDDFMRRTSGVLVRNKDALVQEFRESRELMALMMKMRKEKLTPTERRKVRTQILDILKTLPTFVVIALPGTFITLPVLLKLLPKSAFPSAFSEAD